MLKPGRDLRRDLRAHGRLVISFLLALVAAMAVSSSAHAGQWPEEKGGQALGEAPELLLTFDDGPHETLSKSILDTLKERNYKAIFFWTGRRVTGEKAGLDERLALVQRAVREGHLVGNHTVNHAKLCSVKKEEAEQEIDDNRKLYETLTGLPMFLMRVPYGARCKRLEKMLAERNIRHTHWDLDPQEFRHHSTDLAVQYVTRKLARLENGKRAILLMHDTQPVTATALPRILDWIEEENVRRLEALSSTLDDQGKRKGRRQRRPDKLPIRIISGSEFVGQRYPAPLLGVAEAGLLEVGQMLRTTSLQILPHP